MKILLIIIILFILFLVAVVLIAFFWGSVPPFNNPPSKTHFFGEGSQIKQYVVLGDSLTAGQGGDYQKGIAITTAKHLAKNTKIAVNNFSQSGSTTHDVVIKQLEPAIALKPDIVLLSVGANDVTHITSLDALEKDLNEIMKKLIQSNCNVKIIVTGTPDMGTVKRFLPPLSWIATLQSKRLNSIFNTIVTKHNITYAPIFETVGPIFRNNQSLFSNDNFHPNNDGYAVWNVVLKKSISNALVKQPSHCKLR